MLSSGSINYKRWLSAGQPEPDRRIGEWIDSLSEGGKYPSIPMLGKLCVVDTFPGALCWRLGWTNQNTGSGLLERFSSALHI